MAKVSLVDSDEEAGAQLVSLLDRSGFDVRAAFWYFFSESGVWMLVLSSPRVITDGPRWAYLAVRDAIERQELETQLSLDDIAIVRPDDQLVQAFRGLKIPAATRKSGTRLARNVLNNTFIEDSFIYRVA